MSILPRQQKAIGRPSKVNREHMGAILLIWLRQRVFTFYGILGDSNVLSLDQVAKLRSDEVREQISAILREVPIRLISVTLIASISFLYLPVAFVLISAAAVLIFDIAEVWLFRNSLSFPERTVFRRLAIVTIYFGELLFCFSPAIMWQIDDAFTKAISVGILSASLMRLATIRSIHPVTGLAGIAAQASIIAVSNSYYWLHSGSYRGFAFTSIIAFTSLSYVAAAIVQNHRQIRQSAVSRMVAQQASQAKSYFLTQVSHELRTPLNAIIGMGTAAHLEATTPEQKVHTAVMLQSAKGLGLVLDDLLDISAIEEGLIKIRPRTANLRDEVESAVALFRQSANEAGIDLVVEFRGDVPSFLRLDFDRLRQCISNLLSNALKHTKKGQIIVSTSVSDTDLLEIEVEDTGVGIPAGHEISIFNRFRNGPNLSSGYGLGLSICRAIMIQMAGDITCEPSEVGAKFKIRLPAEIEVALPGKTAEPLRSFDIAGLQVLVVDDIGTNRLVAATYLRILKCNALEAASGAEAIGIALSDFKIDLILLDINMPEMDGLETLKAIRAAEKGRVPLPVIAMTADAAERDRMHYLRSGMDGYVSKPISIEALESEIRRVFTERSSMVASQ